MERRLYEELDEVKAEKEKLRAEHKIKTELSESLRRAHYEQLNKIYEMNSKIEKQARELNEKAETVSSVEQMYNDLKSRMNEKDGTIKHLSNANEKIRAECDNKLKKSEEDSRRMEIDLDESNERNMDQKEKIHPLKEEIEGLWGVSLVSQSKCSEAKEQARTRGEVRERNDMLLNLDEENGKMKEEFKWKKEQFNHLKDAHEKLKGIFCTEKKDWEVEKSGLFSELSSLQESLDSQTKISEDFQNRLKLCNQALSHEESRRRLLEVQLSESKTCFENASLECQVVKSKLEKLTHQKDEELATLRHSLGTKGTLYKEMEYKVGKLEQENQELHASLKEHQEARIQESGAYSSIGKQRNKLKSMEQTHGGCSTHLAAKEEEWSTQLGKLSKNLRDSTSEVKSIDMTTKELEMELDGCQSLIMQLMLQSEESFIMSLVLKLEVAELCKLKPDTEKAEMCLCDGEGDERHENVSLLMKQLEMKETAIVEARMTIEEECKKSESLLRRVESLDKELKRRKEMAEESSICQHGLNEKSLEVEMKSSHIEERLKEVCYALDEANSELIQKIHEGNEADFELQLWKSIAERLKVELEESHEKRRDLETSLLAQVEMEESLLQEKESLSDELEWKEKTIGDLRHEVVLLRHELEKARTKISSIESEKNQDLLQLSEEMDLKINHLQQLVSSERLKLERAVVAQIDAEKSFKVEREELVQLVEEKDRTIDHLHQKVSSLEHSCSALDLSFSLQLADKRAEIESAREAHQKTMATAKAMKAKEIEEKNVVIAELEKERENLMGIVEDLCEKLGRHFGDEVEPGGLLATILQTFTPGDDDEGLSHSKKENVDVHFSAENKKSEAAVSPSQRSPFRELNW